MRSREELDNDDIAGGKAMLRESYQRPSQFTREEMQGVAVMRPVNRVRARCMTCHETKENVYEPVGEAWATKHAQDALAADRGRAHRVEISITYHEIGLSRDHEKFFRRWSAGIRDDFRKYARRRDFFRCVGEVV